MAYTYPTTMTGIYGLATWVNTVTGGWFWSLILLALFAILFFSFKSYQTSRAFAGASFITMVVGILMGAIGLIPVKIIILCIILGAFGIVALRTSNSQSY